MGSDKETLFKTIFEQSPIGLAVVTINGRILEMNPAMMEITKDELNDLDDVVVTDRYVNPEDKEKIFHLIEKNGSVKEKDLKLLDKNGEPYWAQVSITPITYNGKEAHLVSQIDITEKKRMYFRLQEKDFRIQESSIVSMISTIFIQNSRS